MRFRDFLLSPLSEGGQAIKGASKITQAEVKQVSSDLLTKIRDALRLKKSEVKIIGSAGRKPDPSDLSGDIDVAVRCSPEVAAEAVKKLGDQSRAMIGINVFSFGYEVGNKIVQVDLMPVESMKYAEWSFQANPEDLAQGLKGAHRNEVMFAIAKHLPQEVLSKDDDGEPLEIKRYFYDLGKGLMQGVKSRIGKKGKADKNFSTKDKELVTNDPEKITHMFFGEGISPDQVSTFDGAMKAVNAKDFPHKDKREDILQLIRDGIKNKGLKSPKSM